MKQQNKWEQLFEEFMDLTEFSLIKHKNPKLVLSYEDPDGNPIEEVNEGIWSIYDRQGANLGDIDEDRFDNAEQIFERMDIYINDYINEDLENIWEEELKRDLNEVPIELSEWLNHRDELKDYSFELDLIDMICNHANEIDLNNVCYEEEE